jgi:hypothetical protein
MQGQIVNGLVSLHSQRCAQGPRRTQEQTETSRGFLKVKINILGCHPKRSGTFLFRRTFILRVCGSPEESALETTVRKDGAAWTDTGAGVSWASIAAGAIVAAALSLALFALGAGLGLSSISPWAGSGVSASTFKNAAGIYIVIVAVMSSAIGGFLAARLRPKWTAIHNNEVFFRDTAHGLVAWAFATVLSASILGAATSHIVSGAASGAAPAAAQAASSSGPAQLFVDKLFRSDKTVTSAPSAGNNEPARAEVLRLWTSSISESGDLSTTDRSYVARVVAAQTGMSQTEAEKRVNDVIVEAKAAADRARSGAAKLAFWMTAALLFGAFAATLAAVEGGQLRDGNWNERRLVPRSL